MRPDRGIMVDMVENPTLYLHSLDICYTDSGELQANNPEHRVNRRTFLAAALCGTLQLLLAGGAVAASGGVQPSRPAPAKPAPKGKAAPAAPARKTQGRVSAPQRGAQRPAKAASRARAQTVEPDLAPARAVSQPPQPLPAETSESVRDYLYKMRNFDEVHPSDIVLTPERYALMGGLVDRLDRLQRTVGHGFFYLLSLDEAMRQARRPAVGAFSRAELEFIDDVFHADAKNYGFLGKKPLSTLTSVIPQREVVKVPGMGNYLYRGDAHETWLTIQRIMGEQVVLTSGVRGIVKQLHLFLAKAEANGGNLPLASRSLAPPGYSFHGVGDFDVGQRGYGIRNFTSDFTGTEVFRKLEERGYITLRYPRDNFLGVRFEPWHVKVIA